MDSSPLALEAASSESAPAREGARSTPGRGRGRGAQAGPSGAQASPRGARARGRGRSEAALFSEVEANMAEALVIARAGAASLPLAAASGGEGGGYTQNIVCRAASGLGIPSITRYAEL